MRAEKQAGDDADRREKENMTQVMVVLLMVDDDE